MASTRGRTPEAELSGISTKLRACEGCKSRKIRCDKLAPCSACRSANIQCWTSQQPREKRQRVLISDKYEEHLESINTQLSQLQGMLANLKHEPTSSASQHSTSQAVAQTTHSPYTNISDSSHEQDETSSTIPYLGESSFEMHSQQTSRVLETALKSTPPSSHETRSSPLQSIRDLLKERTSHPPKSFSHSLPLIPMQTALKTLRITDNSPDNVLPYMPLADVGRIKKICQAVYFPIKDYSMSDLIVVNGAIFSILSNATEAELKECNIAASEATESIAICESNVAALTEHISPFLEPTVDNIDALLILVQILIGQSKLQKAWALLSLASRLCLDGGYNRLQDEATGLDGLEVREKKKVCFWVAHSLDKALSLNFGRTSNFSDFDITTTYPSLPDGPIFDIYIILLELGKIQGRIYDKLYSAGGQLQTSESKAVAAEGIARELFKLRRQLEDALARVPETESIYYVDTEMTILSNLTLAYRALPSPQPDHPLRFPAKCISTAREALSVHQKLCSYFFSISDNAITMYTAWNLNFCPFTPFIVILGTAILNTDSDDMNLLVQVVESLERASRQAPGAIKLYKICKILLKGAESCIEQSQGQQTTQPTTRQHHPQDRNMTDYHEGVVPSGESEQTLFSDQWDPLPLDHLGNMSTLFDDYLAGNVSLMPILEGDLTQFDMMGSSSSNF